MKKIILFVFTSVFIFTGCKNIVEGLNDDPNNFIDTNLPLILNHSYLNLAAVAESTPARYTCIFTDQFKGVDRQYGSINVYSVNQNSFSGVWDDLYQKGVVQCQIAKKKAIEAKDVVAEGEAILLEAYHFGEAALLFGDVPFSEANKVEKFSNPKYEGQKLVLQSVIKLLDLAISKLGKKSADGNVLSSKSTMVQVANGLKARYSLALKDYASALKFAKSADFKSFDNSWSIKHKSANNAENLFWQFQIEERQDYIKCAEPKTKKKPVNFSYMLKLLDSKDKAYKGNTKTDESARYAFYAKGEDINTDNGGFAAQTASFPVLSFPEVQLIIAECELRTGNNASALVALNKLRTENAKRFNKKYDAYDLADFGATGIANPKKIANVKDALLMEILLEKYCSVIGLPTFQDVNRTKNVIGVPIKKSDKKTIPQRFLYSSTESSSNKNAPKVVDLYVPTPVNK